MIRWPLVLEHLHWDATSAGIDMAFYLVESLCGAEAASETARYIDYPR